MNRMQLLSTFSELQYSNWSDIFKDNSKKYKTIPSNSGGKKKSSYIKYSSRRGCALKAKHKKRFTKKR